VLTFEVREPQKNFSHLPVHAWHLQLKMDMQLETEGVSSEVYGSIAESGLSLACKVPAKYSKRAQVYEVALDREWTKKLHFLSLLHKMKRMHLLSASLQGVQELAGELLMIYGQIDPEFQKAVNLPDFLLIILRQCPEKKQSKAMRNSLREAVKAVKSENAAGEQDPAESCRRKGADSSAKLDIADPVVLLNQALARLTNTYKAPDEPANAGDAEGKSGETKMWKFSDAKVAPPSVQMTIMAENSWSIGEKSAAVEVALSIGKVKSNQKGRKQ